MTGKKNYSWLKTKKKFNYNGMKVHGYVLSDYIEYLDVDKGGK